MTAPLSPLSEQALNTKVPTTPPEADVTWHDPPSSPFLDLVEQENAVPAIDTVTKPQPSNTLSRTTTPKKGPSSFEILLDVEQVVDATPRPASRHVQESPTKSFVSARESPMKQSPTKALTEADIPEPALRENEGLTITMETVEEVCVQEDIITDTMGEVYDATIDDTCFSAFSEIPNLDMTSFAKLRGSPTKEFGLNAGIATPRARTQMTPSTARRQQQYDERSGSPTPRRSKRDADTTNLLLDFTEQIQAFSASTRRSPSRGRGSPMKSQTEPNLLAYINNQRSPGKHTVLGTPSDNRKLLNLLDFELPPPATPRSIPTITVREMESMKSSYLSQISQLNASVEGKDATIESLSKAVFDAEARVGEAQEAVREERSAREHAEKEKSEWEKKGHEVESVLKSIRKEIMASEKEREELLRKLEEAERRADEAESKAADAEAKAIEAEGKVVDQSVFVPSSESESIHSSPRFTADQVQKQIDEKVETLCRELHLVYKKKHETKVSALKKSYEAKAEKKLAELNTRVAELTRANEDLQVHRDATFSGVLPADLPTAERAVDLKRLDEQKAEIQEQKARLAGLEQEMRSVRAEHTELLHELEQERVEKGELVAAAEQMLSLQAEMGAPAVGEVVEDFRKSIGVGGTPKPSGLRAPGESRIGRAGPGMYSGKSRLMGNIERMGGMRSH